MARKKVQEINTVTGEVLPDGVTSVVATSDFGTDVLVTTVDGESFKLGHVDQLAEVLEQIDNPIL